MRLDLHCPNCGRRQFDADFIGWSKIICYNCIAKTQLTGTNNNYYVRVTRIYDPKTRSERLGNILPIYCPHCGKLIRKLKKMSKNILHCPECGNLVNTEIMNDIILMKITD